jgi:hypothetical protein
MKPALIGLILLGVTPLAIAQHPAAGAPQKTIAGYMGLHAFPAKDQTTAQQQQDEIFCYGWAKQDSCFDPLAALLAQQQTRGAAQGQPAAPATGGAETKAAVGSAAAGAATGAVVGAIAGDPGKGAAAGAAGGGILGLARAKRAEKAAEQKALQQQRQLVRRGQR